MKILIADKFPEKYINELKNNNLDVIYEPKLGENDLAESAKEVDILVVRSTVVNEETISETKKLNLIIRAGAGVNNINIPAANKKGIYVANCPGKNSIAVAELAIGLMIALLAKKFARLRRAIFACGAKYQFSPYTTINSTYSPD